MLVSQLAGPDMLIDGYDQFNQRQDAEVVNITPDDASEEPAEDTLLADDCRSLSDCHPAPDCVFRRPVADLSCR